MDTHSKQIAEMVQSGEYFKRSRAWYRALYIAPIAERSFFLLIAGLAGFTALLSIIALGGLMPLVDHPAILLSTPHVDDVVPRLTKLAEKDQPMSQELMKFYVTSYVQSREGYDSKFYPIFYHFIQAQSDKPTFEKYQALYDRSNKQSPAAMLGATGKRLVTIDSITLKTDTDPKLAIVQFTTQIEGGESTARTHWTANLQFYYSDLVVTPTKNADTGEEGFSTQDPQFQVVDYALTKAN